MLSWIVTLSLATGVLSMVAALGLLLFPKPALERMLPHLVSFAIGSLLGAAFLEILPHAFETPGGPGAQALGLAVLAGLLAFFLMEKIVLWRHCHVDPCEVHLPEPGHAQQSAGMLILVGDGLHNLVDGVLIAAAVLTDLRLGVVTTAAIIAHEIPQELGDFSILLQSGYTRKRAIIFNFISSLATLLGAVVAFFSLEAVSGYIPYVLAVAAASFLYIALTDLIPNLHKRAEMKSTLQQLLLIGGGVATIALTHLLLE